MKQAKRATSTTRPASRTTASCSSRMRRGAGPAPSGSTRTDIARSSSSSPRIKTSGSRCTPPPGSSSTTAIPRTPASGPLPFLARRAQGHRRAVPRDRERRRAERVERRNARIGERGRHAAVATDLDRSHRQDARADRRCSKTMAVSRAVPRRAPGGDRRQGQRARATSGSTTSSEGRGRGSRRRRRSTASRRGRPTAAPLSTPRVPPLPSR